MQFVASSNLSTYYITIDVVHRQGGVSHYIVGVDNVHSEDTEYYAYDKSWTIGKILDDLIERVDDESGDTMSRVDL